MVADKIGAMEQSNQRRNVMLDNYKIGNLITLLRKGKGLTGEKFAEALGVSPQAVSMWENASISRRANDIAIQIGIAIGCITGERKQLDKTKERDENYAAMCREHIKNLKKHREYMRGWLGELLTERSY